MHQTVIEIEKELHDFVKSLPAVEPSDLKVGNLFVVASKRYGYCFGVKNTALFCVTSKTKTMIKTHLYFGPEDTSVIPGDNFTFKGCSRDCVVLRFAGPDDVAKAKEFQDRIVAAEFAAKRHAKSQKDVFVLWNYASESCGNAARGDIVAWLREGFVLEAFDGNGRLNERVRMLADADAGMECADNGAIERMVRAYAVCHYGHENIRDGSVFRFQYVPEMD